MQPLSFILPPALFLSAGMLLVEASLGHLVTFVESVKLKNFHINEQK